MRRINITCPACGSKAYLRPASVVYGDKAPDPDAKYYVCGRYPACDCYVAAHRKTMLPMGTLADKALRKKRHDAHVALDSLWKNGVMSRKEAYRLLQLSMGLPAEDAHNRIFENYTGEVATWYSASPSIFESDCRISPQTIFEVVYQGRLCARDGNGDFEGKIPFVPFFEFERREAIRCSKKLPNLKGYEQMKEKLLSLPGGEQYSLHGACQDNWIYALNFGKETVQVIDTSEWMGRSYELIAVLYTHKPTGFQFTNYCIRPAGIISSSSRHDLLLYDWAEHQAGADSY